ncbi:LuxR family transcriptional regulator [Pseudovibrio ascidiaceicola]|uniref:LuxR family transcriptional regulator n=1 Tax=Pseudovibrio ascidiaceicola TaxID=285279 RepID=UPI000D695078|nr:LuxR family transcriptional regulator [Pseudovibrio ascidiaceicola]
MVRRRSGRPAIVITDETCLKVRRLAAQGLSERQIADMLGFHQTTLIRKKKQHSTFLSAIEQGKAEGIAKVSNALFQKAMDGNVTAQMFFLKSRDPDNWSDRKAYEVSTEPEMLSEAHSKPSDIEIARRIAFLLQKGLTH